MAPPSLLSCMYWALIAAMLMSSYPTHWLPLKAYGPMFPDRSDTLFHPLLAMLTHISLYIRNPDSPDSGPAVPGA